MDNASALPREIHHSNEGAKRQPSPLLDSGEKKQQLAASDDEKIDSRLGASVVKGADLHQIIANVFDDEYDPQNIDKRVQARKSRRTFDFEDENLGMLTECPVRLFEVLDTFVAADRQVWGQADEIDNDQVAACSDQEPSDVSKCRLLNVIQSVEDLFTGYATDTIDRVIQDFKAQSELRTSSGSSAFSKYLAADAASKDYPTKRTFKIQHEYAILTSLLLNDIQAYADLYSKFRKRNFEYFNLTAKEQMANTLEIKPVSSQCTSDSEEDDDADDKH